MTTIPQCDIDRMKRLDTPRLIKEYASSMRDCFGRGWPAASVMQDARANELLARGITHIPNIFGDIEIKTDWQDFQRNQRAALATRGR